MEQLVIGLKGQKSLKVNEGALASKLGSGGLDVLGTPALAALMEGAAFQMVEDLLPEGSSSVGTRLDLEHLAATPIGLTVTATAELVKVEGRKLLFVIEARDDRELIGKASHERFIIQIEKFLQRAQSKHNV